MSSPAQSPRFHPFHTIPHVRSDMRLGTLAGLPIDQFHPISSDHRPVSTVKLFWSSGGVHMRFDVKDKYVIAKRTAYLSEVYKDSCVEFFVQPKSNKGYFNFELNALGTLLLYYVEDHLRNAEGKLRKFSPVKRKLVRELDIISSITKPITTEISDTLEWSLSIYIPFNVLEHYVGSLSPTYGQPWRANFQKCADESSHPHWGSWANIGDELNFHQPKQFGTLYFEKRR